MAGLMFRGALAAAAALLALTGCAPGSDPSQPNAELLAVIDKVDADAFTKNHPGTFVELSRDAGLESVSILNYDPTRPPPNRQDVVAWGRVGTGPSTREATVLSVAVQEGQKFYVVEFDPDSKSQLFEDGSWFLSEDRSSYVQGQLALIDTLLP